MSSLHRRSLTRLLEQPSLAPSRRSRFWPGATPGDKGPRPGSLRARAGAPSPSYRTSPRGARLREAGVAASLAASPGPRLLFIHSPAGSGGCGWRPGRGGSSRWGAGGGRAGGTERDATRPFSAEVGRRLLVWSAGWAARRGRSCVLPRPSRLATGGLPQEPRPHPCPPCLHPCPPHLLSAPAWGAPFANPTPPGARILIAAVTQWIIHLNSSSWLKPFASR